MTNAEQAGWIAMLRLRSCYALMTIVGSLFCTFVSAQRACAQTQHSSSVRSLSAYDVASIKPFTLDGNLYQMRIMTAVHSAHFQASGVTLKMLIHLAYAVQENHIEGGPAWIDSDLFEVNAKSDEDADAFLKGMSDEAARKTKQVMLQALLADRFNLKVNQVERAGTVDVLVVAKTGLKLKLSAAQDGPNATSAGDHFSVQVGQDTMTFHRTPMHFFVDFLSQQTQEDVIDKTSLTGTYDFVLHYRQRPPGSQDSAGDADSDTPDLRDALPSQLGLKLASHRGQVKTILIEGVEKPTPN